LAAPRTSPISEAALVALARGGDDAAFTMLVRTRQGVVRGLLRRLTGGDAALADDLAQETFVQAWRTLGQLRSPAAFDAWLRQIALNCWLQHARRKRIPMDILEDDAAASDGGLSSVPGTIDLERALERLRPPERLCVVLCFAEGMNHREIVEATGLALGTVKSHVSRGTAKLRALLETDKVTA
jgi:RNA polymerase sigma-70 factor, ECF subfamily